VAASGDDAFRHADQPAGWDHTPPAETWADARFNGADQPVVNVAYWDAYAFAKWSGRRLPTEAEWLKAAAYEENQDDQRIYPPVPVGGDLVGTVLAVSDAGNRLAAPVPTTSGEDRSPVGCMHMGGNASEWVDLKDVRPGESPAGLAGGNWFFSARAANVKDVRAKSYERSVRDKTMGFRCAVDADRVAGSSK
jgi:formylglycine-generating enzyme required for sulfatase activity